MLSKRSRKTCHPHHEGWGHRSSASLWSIQLGTGRRSLADVSSDNPSIKRPLTTTSSERPISECQRGQKRGRSDRCDSDFLEHFTLRESLARGPAPGPAALAKATIAWALNPKFVGL